MLERRRRRASLACLLAAASVVSVPATPAAALSSGVSGGVLTIAGTSGDDSAIVQCLSASMKINGNDPDSGPVACSSITSVSADLQGGDDFLNLVASPASFTSLASSTIVGGDGSDSVSERAGVTTFTGGPGADRITLAEGNDVFDGGPGRDGISMYGASTGVALTDTSLTSTLWGTDTLSSVETATVNTDGGVCDTSGFSGTTTVQGGLGADTIIGGPGDNFLRGSAGVDSLQGGGGDDRLEPGPGNDTVSGGGGRDTFSDLGTASAALTDTTFTSASSGTDSMSGIEHAELIVSSATPKTIDASGFSGTTVLKMGGSAAATLIGSPQADVIAPGAGDDIVDGGGGRDTFEGHVGLGQTGTLTDTAFSSPLDGNDTLTSIESAILTGTGGAETFDAGAFHHEVAVNADDGDDHVIGGSRADTLNGGKGNDKLVGRAGDDTLIGGKGKDTCRGGSGSDRLRSCENT